MKILKLKNDEVIYLSKNEEKKSVKPEVFFDSFYRFYCEESKKNFIATNITGDIYVTEIKKGSFFENHINRYTSKKYKIESKNKKYSWNGYEESLYLFCNEYSFLELEKEVVKNNTKDNRTFSEKTFGKIYIIDQPFVCKKHFLGRFDGYFKKAIVIGNAINKSQGFIELTILSLLCSQFYSKKLKIEEIESRGKKIKTVNVFLNEMSLIGLGFNF